MKLGRMERIRTLKDAGYTTDDLCERLQRGDESHGAPSYMRDPAGNYVAVTADLIRLLDTEMRIWLGPVTKDGQPWLQSSVASGETYRSIPFKGGVRLTSHWNYRIVRLRNNVFSLREVHYEDGREVAMSAIDATFGSAIEDDETDETMREEIVRMLERALKCAKERPIFTPPASWVNGNDVSVSHDGTD